MYQVLVTRALKGVMYRSIVVGTDSSERAYSTVEQASRLAREIGADLHVVCGVLVPMAPTRLREPAGINAFERTAERALESQRENVESTADRCRRRGVATTAHVHFGDPAATLLGVADRVAADLIVVGDNGLTGLRRLFGSVPGRVVRAASVPVLVVRTTGRRRRRGPTGPIADRGRGSAPDRAVRLVVEEVEILDPDGDVDRLAGPHA